MRWLFHVLTEGSLPSVGADGFVHASFKDAVAESARLYFPEAARLRVLQIDPRRLDARVELASTPRGPMPHIHGEIPPDAIRATLALRDVPNAPDRVTGTKIAFVAFEGMTLLDLVGAYDPLARIAKMGFDPTATCSIVTADAARPWSEGGGSLVVHAVRPTLEAYDAVVVPGGPGARALVTNTRITEWIAAFPHNRLIASVCTGALVLGAAGRLRGKRATTHRSALGDLAAYGATAVAERVIDEGQLVTAAGVTSAIDLALHLVRRLEGDEVAAAIALQMEWPH